MWYLEGHLVKAYFEGQTPDEKILCAELDMNLRTSTQIKSHKKKNSQILVSSAKTSPLSSSYTIIKEAFKKRDEKRKNNLKYLPLIKLYEKTFYHGAKQFSYSQIERHTFLWWL